MSGNGRDSLIDTLLASVGDAASQEYHEELRAFLKTLPIQVNPTALHEYAESHHSITRSNHTVRSPRRQGGAAEQPEGLSLPLPSIIGADHSSVPQHTRGMKHFPHKQDSHVHLSVEELEASAKRLRIPKKALAALYQQRVSPRQDNVPHIFSLENGTLRSGFSSIETKTTKKSFLPNPPSPRAQFSLADVGATATNFPLQSSSPRKTMTVDVATVEAPRRTFQSKIRETLLHTGKPVQTAEARHIPNLKERFEASYAPLYHVAPQFETRCK